MIYEVITSDFNGKCGNCKFFDTDNGIDGHCINLENKLKSLNRYRSYNSKACIRKETVHVQN